MSLANFIRLAEECDGRAYQFALGGCVALLHVEQPFCSLYIENCLVVVYNDYVKF